MIKKEFSTLGRLVGPDKVADFLSDRLECKPNLSSIPQLSNIEELISIDDIDHFFSTIKYRTTECFCVNGNNPIDVSEFSSRGVVDSRKALRLFDKGATIVLNRVHLYHPVLAEFCIRLSLELSAPCQSNVYLTPPNSKGFNLHYDTHDVFMAQVAGEKEWRVYGPAVDLPLVSQGTSERLEAVGEPLVEAVLRAGDVLYIPRGWMHEGIATTSTSLHITFGVYFFTWADAILETVSNCLLRDGRYRSALPIDFLDPAFDDAAISSRLGRFLTEIASSIDVKSLRRSLRAQHNEQMQASTSGLLKQLILARDVGDRTQIQALGRIQSTLEPDGTLVVEAPGGSIRIKDEGREAALACLSGRIIVIGELSGWLPVDARIELVRRLVAAEVVNVIE